MHGALRDEWEYDIDVPPPICSERYFNNGVVDLMQWNLKSPFRILFGQ
jgi:hypothetical protein